MSLSFATLAGQISFFMEDGLPYWLSISEYLTNQASPLLQLWKAISGAEVLSVWSDTDSGNRAALVFAII